MYYYEACAENNWVSEAKCAFTGFESAPPLSLGFLPSLHHYRSPLLPGISQSPLAPLFLLLAPTLSETKQTKKSRSISNGS